jgi:hypothetical protein
MFAQVDEFHNFTFLEQLAALDLQMPWLKQGACHSLPGNEHIQKCVEVIRPTVLVDHTTQMCQNSGWA